jgi:hypothetical protein
MNEYSATARQTARQLWVRNWCSGAKNVREDGFEGGNGRDKWCDVDEGLVKCEDTGGETRREEMRCGAMRCVAR